MGDVEHPTWLKSLPVAPEFRPTEAEFAEPISYILKIEEIAREYGICKIIPPYAKAAKKVVVSNLNRSLSSSSNASGHAANGSRHQSRRMGKFMCGSQWTKPKIAVSDSSIVETEEKTELGGSVLSKEPLGKAKFATRKQQLGWNFKRARGVAHSQNHKLVWQSGESYTLEQFEARAKQVARSRLGSVKDVSHMGLETLFWRAAADKPISVEYANDIPGSAFAESTDMAAFNPLRFRKRKRGSEDADQRCGSKTFVRYGSMDFLGEDEDGEEVVADEVDFLEASKCKTSASDTSGDSGGGAGSKLANSGWNMRNVARSNGSLLRYMPEEVPGVTTPMVYLGMLFSWFAWHVEDHELHSLNYLHTGASKTWYAVPGEAAPALEEAIRVQGYGGNLNRRAAFSLLGEKTTVMSPEVLVALGVPCCRLVQNVGEYVVTFPRAYHLGFSHVAKDAAVRRAAMKSPPMLSHQQLLYHLTISLPQRMPASCPSEPRSSRLKVRQRSIGEEMVKSTYLHDVAENNQFLKILLEHGVSRCILAVDPIRPGVFNTLQDESIRRGLAEQAGSGFIDTAGSLIAGNFSHCGDQSLVIVEPGSTGFMADQHSTQQPTQVRLQSELDGAAHMENSGEKHKERLCSSTEGFSLFMHDNPTSEGSPFDTGPHSGGLKTTAASSLGIDWGTLPCAACGILCYASMAVVQPTASAALSFKPIFAAAGLEQYVFEVHDPLRTSSQPQLMHAPAVEGSQSLTISQAISLHGPSDMISETPTIWNTAQQLSGRMESSGVLMQDVALEQGILNSSPIAELSNYLQNNQNSFHTGQSESGVSQVNLVQGSLDMRASPSSTGPGVKSGIAPTLLRSKPNPLPETCLDLSNLLSDSEYITQGDLNLDVLELENAANLDSTASLSFVLPESGEQGRDLTKPHSVKSDTCIRDGALFGTALCEKEGQQESATSLKKDGESKLPMLSSLQLLASNYDDNSDLEDEHLRSPDNFHSLGEEKTIVEFKQKTLDGKENAASESTHVAVAGGEEMTAVDDEYGIAKGAEVCAKPDCGVGGLFTDVVGVSADVLGLTLFTFTGNLNASAPVASSGPMFTYSSLVEGPKTLNNVFVTAGFSFGEYADPTTVGSPADGTTDGKVGEDTEVMNMGDLYHRINSQALTFDSDPDEQMMFHFGLRSDLFQEPLDLEYSKNMSAGHVSCLQQQQEASEAFLYKNSTIPSNGMEDNSTLLADPPLTNKGGFLAQPDEMLHSSSVKQLTGNLPVEVKSDMRPIGFKRLNEDMSTDDRSGLNSGPFGIGLTQTNDSSVESGVQVLPERKVSMSKACRSVARPRILCLEHAVVAQQKLKNVGGANVIVVCHSDFEKFERRAKDLTQELGEEQGWTDVPFSTATDDEINMINTAVHAEDEEHRKVNDWVTQMGLFVYDRFADRQTEASDESEDDAVGRPFREGRSGLMTSKSLPVLDGECITDEATTFLKRTKVSKKKTCTIAGKWCGKAWRFNQVHPLLGGCKRVDPSQLGMSSTSLYSLSQMSDFDGGKQRKGGSSSKIDGVRDLLVPARILEDQPNARIRNRKRKMLGSGASVQSDRGIEGQKKPEIETMDRPPLATNGVNVEPGEHKAFPKLRTLTRVVRDASNTNHPIEEYSISQDGLGSSTVNSPKADKLPILVSETGANSLPILSSRPISAQGPTAIERSKNGLNMICSATGGFDYSGAGLATVSRRETAVVPITPNLTLNDMRAERNAISLDDGVWHKTASLTNVYSILRHGVTTLNKGKKGRPSNFSSSSSGKKKRRRGNGLAFVWHDAPIAYSSSMHPAMTSGRTRQHSSHLSLTQNEHERVYIPDISTAQWAPVTEKPLACESTCNIELYSSSNTITRMEEVSGNLQNRGLLKPNSIVEETVGGELLEPIFEEGTARSISLVCSAEEPALSMEHTVVESPLDTAMMLKDQQKRVEHGPSVFHEDNCLMATSLSSMLVDGVTESDLVVNLKGRSREISGSTSNQVVFDDSHAQEMVQDAKNVAKLAENGIGSFPSGLDSGHLNIAGHLQVCLSQEGSAVEGGSHSDLAGQPNGVSCEKPPAIELTPILGVPDSQRTSPQGMIGGSESLVNFAGGTSLSVQLETLMENQPPQRALSRGRSAVRARGKRPKNIGWANFKPLSSPQLPQPAKLKNSWQLTLHSASNATAGSGDEGDFSIENLEKTIVLHDESISGAILNEGGEASASVEDDDEADEKDDELLEVKDRKLHGRSKKKAKQKKRVLPSKNALHEDGEFQCDLEGCRMSFDTEAELQIHKRNRCTFKGCGKRFFIHKYLLQHRRVHMDDRPLKCPWKGCKQSFKWAWARTEHIRVHTGERPYSCPECKQTFRFVSDFSRHKRNTGHTKQ